MTYNDSGNEKKNTNYVNYNIISNLNSYKLISEDSTVVSKIDSVIIFMSDSIISQCKINNLDYRKLSFEKSKNITLNCYSLQDYPKMISISEVIKNDFDSNVVFTETFYFGNKHNNYPIIYVMPISEFETSVQIISDNRNVISYIKNIDNKSIFLNKINNFTAETKLSALLFTLVNNLVYFDTLKFNFIQKPSINSIPVIEILKNELVLYENSYLGSHVLHIAKKNDLLIFLDYSTELGTKDGKLFPWYKVSTEDKKHIGWIIGDPKNINDYTDGD